MNLDDKVGQDDAKTLLESVITANILMDVSVLLDYLSPALDLGLKQPELMIITGVTSITSLLTCYIVYQKLINSSRNQGY